MSTRDLIDAIAAGDSVAVQAAFSATISQRIAERLDTMRQDVAKNMFKEAASMGVEEEVDTGEYGARKSAPSSKEDQEGVFKKHRERMEKLRKEKDDEDEAAEMKEEADPKPVKVGYNHLHVQHVGGGKYKVHAVGKNFAHGINVGEHLSDSELDDFQEMGGKIKHVKGESK